MSTSHTKIEAPRDGARGDGAELPAAAAAAAAAFGVAVAVVLALKLRDLSLLSASPMLALYGLAVGAVVLARVAIALGYRPEVPCRHRPLPLVSVIVPAYNEAEVIEETLRRCLASDYPRARLEVIAVDDGSTDATARAIARVRRTDPRLTMLRSRENRGKRQAVARGLRRARGEIVVFVDSDSMVEPDAVRRIVRYFGDPAVGAVCGKTGVANKGANVLTRAQAIRYEIAFRVVKASEARFGAVTCCCGCFSAFRRSALEGAVDAWLGQTLLGVRCTYGDDRSLTNLVLRRWKVAYAPDARARTIVPEAMSVFVRQQLRWKRSWVRESARGSRFMWRKAPAAASLFYASALITVLAPIVAFRALLLGPLDGSRPTLWYLMGAVIVGALYGLLHRVHRASPGWTFGVVAVLVHVGLLWQTPYAAATVRSTTWGTR